MPKKTVKKETEIANLARRTTERSFETAFENYMKLKARQDALILKIAMQKRAWRNELANLQRIDFISGRNPFVILEAGNHEHRK